MSCAALFYISGQDARYDNKRKEALQQINTSPSVTDEYSLKKRDLLEFLSSRPWRFPWFCREGGEYPGCVFRQPRLDLSDLDLSRKVEVNDGKHVSLVDLGLYNININKSNFEKVFLNHVTLENVVFNDVIFTWAVFGNFTTKRVSLRDIDGQYLTIAKSRMIDFGILNSDLRNSHFQRVSLRNSKIVGTDFSQSTLHGVDFSESFLESVRFLNSDIRGRFQNSVLENVNFRGSRLVRSNFENADLRNVDFSEADLERAKLRRSDLQQSNLQEANLKDADLRGADLRGIDLDSTEMSGALYTSDLSSCYWQNESPCATMFPEGFDPALKNMVFSTSVSKPLYSL